MTCEENQQIAPEVGAGLLKLGITEQPIIVRHAPSATAQPNRCIYNVQEYLQSTSGAAIFGWRVTLWLDIMLEAIGHVIASTDNGLLCVTPPKSESGTILFVPDPKVCVDVNQRMPSQRAALIDDSRIQRLIEVISAIRAIKSTYKIINSRVNLGDNDAKIIKQLEHEKGELMLHLRSDYGKPSI